MKRDQIMGRWTAMKGHAKARWADLTDDDLLAVEGERDKLVGAIQGFYGMTKEEAERQVDELDWI